MAECIQEIDGRDSCQYHILHLLKNVVLASIDPATPSSVGLILQSGRAVKYPVQKGRKLL